jgi:hypothetical protein
MQQLQQLVETLQAQEAIKKDYVAASAHLSFVNGRLVMTHAGTNVEFTPTPHFHAQMAEKVGIPKGYYDRMKDKALTLLDDNVNHWLSDEGKNLLIRAFEPGEGDNVARALLSDRYNMIDNMEVLLETLDAIKATGIPVNVAGAELSDTRMFLQITCPEIEVKATEMLKAYRKSIAAGSGVITGFELQNSEIGKGTFQVCPRAVVLACQNGLIKTNDALRRVHLGGKMDELGFYNNPEVKRANRELVKKQVSHAVKLFLSKDYLTNLVNSFTELGDKKIEAPVQQVIQVIASEYSITDERKNNILNFFIDGGDRRRIGIVNALTEEAQTLTDIDLKHDSEAITFDLLQKFDKIEAAAFKLDRSAN